MLKRNVDQASPVSYSRPMHVPRAEPVGVAFNVSPVATGGRFARAAGWVIAGDRLVRHASPTVVPPWLSGNPFAHDHLDGHDGLRS